MDNVDWELLLSVLIAIYEFGFLPGFFIGMDLMLIAWQEDEKKRESEDDKIGRKGGAE